MKTLAIIAITLSLLVGGCAAGKTRTYNPDVFGQNRGG